MKRLILGFLSLLTLGQMALVALPVSAACDPASGNTLDCLTAANPNPNSGGAADAGAQLPILIGKIIRTVLGLLGIIFLVLMVYAGFLWMTARGEEEPVSKAKDIIKQAIIGVIIVFLAYALTGFVISSITKATTGQ
jgi:VIT1/CCC1 family predicted Fe2+/Mn2+ transporter